jgi:hypothetical protein
LHCTVMMGAGGTLGQGLRPELESSSSDGKMLAGR